MKFVHSGFTIVGLAGALAISGCAISSPPAAQYGAAYGSDAGGTMNVPLPTFYGLYAVDDGQLIRLDGPPDWERQTWSDREDLPPDVSFLVFSRQLPNASDSLSNTITIGRVASVRYERTTTGALLTHPVGSVWATPNLPGYQLALEFEPVPGHPDMIIVKPELPLSAGLYSLKVGTGGAENSRFGIAWSELQQSDYAARYCVNEIAGSYQPCDATMSGSGDLAASPTQPAAEPEEDFVVRGLHSSRVTGDDGTPQLVIEGQLVNESTIPAIMPALSATLLDAQNQVLQALPAVTLPATPLPAGGVYNFRINVTNPAPDASQVRVTPTA